MSEPGIATPGRHQLVEGRKAMRAGRSSLNGLPRGRSGRRETFDGLPPEVWQVHVLQQKTSWSDNDHARIAQLTRRWTDAQRRRYEERWNWGRPARWH
jgi:hypothetical protein